jgi:hypothetical protein
LESPSLSPISRLLARSRLHTKEADVHDYILLFESGGIRGDREFFTRNRHRRHRFYRAGRDDRQQIEAMEGPTPPGCDIFIAVRRVGGSALLRVALIGPAWRRTTELDEVVAEWAFRATAPLDAWGPRHFAQGRGVK